MRIKYNGDSVKYNPSIYLLYWNEFYYQKSIIFLFVNTNFIIGQMFL